MAIIFLYGTIAMERKFYENFDQKKFTTKSILENATIKGQLMQGVLGSPVISVANLLLYTPELGNVKFLNQINFITFTNKVFIQIQYKKFTTRDI